MSRRSSLEPWKAAKAAKDTLVVAVEIASELYARGRVNQVAVARGQIANAKQALLILDELLESSERESFQARLPPHRRRTAG